MKIEIYFCLLSLIFFNCKKEVHSTLVETEPSVYTITIEGKVINKNHIGLDSVRINLEIPSRFDSVNINGSFNYSFPLNGIQEVITQITFTRRSYYDTSFYVKYSPTLNNLSFPEIIMQNVIDTFPSTWTQLNGPLGNVTSIAGFGSTLYAGTTNYTGGVYCSTDKGLNWTTINSGLKGIFYNPNTYNINCLAVLGNTLLAGDGGSYNGIFRSTNRGESWAESNSGIAMIKYKDPTTGPPNSYRDGYDFVKCFGQIGNNIFVSVGSMMYRSTDNGASWDTVLAKNIYSIANDDANIYAGGNEGVYRSTNNGVNWSIVNSGLTGGVAALAISGTNMYAGGNGVFLSTNNGESWNSILSGISIKKLAVFEKGIFAGTDDIENGGRVYLSTNIGSSWDLVYSQPKNTAIGLINTHLISLTVFDNCLLIGTDSYGIFRKPISAIISDLNKK